MIQCNVDNIMGGEFVYCRNCGARLKENEEKCESCSFVKGYGKQYCGICGEKLACGQKTCTNCGNEVESPAASDGSSEGRIVDSYGITVSKINKLRLVLSVVALLLIATLVFVPIYRCSYIPVSEDVSHMNDIKDVIEDGRVEKNFSLYEDFAQMLRILFDRTGEARTEKLLVLEFGIFAIFEVLFASVLAALTVKRIIEYAIRLKKTHEATLLTYDGIKKYGESYTKTGLFKKNAVIGLIIYAGFDVVFTQIFGLYTGTGEVNFFYRYMLDVSGLSVFSLIAVALIAGIVALRVLTAKEEKKLCLEIIKANI